MGKTASPSPKSRRRPAAPSAPPPRPPLRRAVFLDRDGTLNRMVHYPDHGLVDSPFLPRQLALAPHAAEALRRLRRKGFLLVLVSNQPGMAKGHMTRRSFEGIERAFDARLAAGGARLDAKYYCLHHPQARVAALRRRCACRKPGDGMLRQAAREHGIDLARSYMIGDGVVDVQAGRKAGCRTIFIGSFKPELWKLLGGGRGPDHVARGLREAAAKVR